MKFKQIFSSVLLGLVFMGNCVTPVLCRESIDAPSLANSQTVDINDLADELFSSYDADKSVIKLPEGGFLQGHCIVVDLYDESIVYSEYDSDADPNSLTVEEAKDDLISQAQVNNGLSIEARGANVPSQVKIMNSGAHYTSNNFTNSSGWRFSGYLFRCANGSLGYQTWRSYVDGGRVGALGEAINQKNNPNASYGYDLNVGKSLKLGTNNNGGYISLCYYTYAPISGTYYTIDFE